MTEAAASPTPGLEEIVNRMCPKVCGHCGERLPRPGEDCTACGEIPSLLREDAVRQLSEPGALAAKQAEYHRGEAKRLLEMLVAEHLAADRVLFTDGLRQALDRAEAGLTGALAAYDQAEAPLEGLRAAEERLARDVEDARKARAKFDLEARKAERHGKGAEEIVLARRTVVIADEEVEKRTSALVAAQDARVRAEGLLAGVDEEVGRLAQVRDYAALRLEAPPEAGVSVESLRALAEPVLGIAKELLPLRLGRPRQQFTSEDVAGNDLVAFAVGVAGELGVLTGVLARERASGFADGFADGRKQVKAEWGSRPRLVGNTALAPGSVDVPGGVYSPGQPLR